MTNLEEKIKELENEVITVVNSTSKSIHSSRSRSLQEISLLLGISDQRIREIQRIAIIKIKNIIEDSENCEDILEYLNI